MKFNIVTNHRAHGLHQDCVIIRDLLEHRGHKTCDVMWTDHAAPPADVNIFLEVFTKRMFPFAAQQWLIPNLEWWTDEHTAELDSFRYVLLKTYDAARLLRRNDKNGFDKSWVDGRIFYTGFTSCDYYMPEVKRENRFLHIAGNSRVKNTEAVLEVWQKFKPIWPLTILTQSDEYLRMASAIPGVCVIEKLEEKALRLLLNSHRFHICPSGYEGWGHALHEAQGVGAIIITSNIPPMSEITGITDTLLIPTTKGQDFHQANIARVSAEDIFNTVMYAMNLSLTELTAISARAREGFLIDRVNFQRKFEGLI
jgi:glycosyltransferase involved in cell wall biosynthesis